MQIKPYNYETCKEWWDKRGFPSIPAEILPETGYTVWAADVPVLSGWIYLPQGNAKIGMFMWPVSNPDANGVVRNAAWFELMKHINQVAKEHGLVMIFTGTAHDPLVRRMEKHGYVSYETGSANMLKQVEV